MLAFTSGVASLCSVLSLATAGRITRSVTTTVNFEETISKMKAVDRYSSEDDRFVVFETNGTALVEVAAPEPAACSLETLKTALLDCPKRGMMCVALYKFNYPRALGSSTMRGKSIVMLAQDKEIMGNYLGGTFKATKVTMEVIPFVWQKLLPQLTSNSVSPAVTLELSDSAEINGLNGESLWGKIKSSASRVDESEGPAFIQHATDQIEKAAGQASRVVPTQHLEIPKVDEETAEPRQTQISPGVPVAQVAPAVDTQKIAKEVEEILSKRIEEIARKVAREEVGMAVRKLGTDIGEATRSVGKFWIDKSNGVVS